MISLAAVSVVLGIISAQPNFGHLVEAWSSGIDRFFSVQIWPQVKAANPHLSSVTEIGAVVGAMWRDLDPVEKQRYNDQFNKEKVTH